MIYLTNKRYQKTVSAYLESPRAEGVADRIRIIAYQDLPRQRDLPTGTYVFADYERLTPAQWELARRVWQQLDAARHPVRLLSDPRRVLARYPLLRRLFDEGINDFNAVRATEPFDALDYPVFVREEHDHTGSLTGLLPDPAAVERALAELTALTTKYRRRDLLVVEFLDTSGGAGLYRRFAAFRVGDRILPRYLSYHPDWIVKMDGRALAPELLADEQVYLFENPHAARLMELFEVAGIDYGRMDYGLVGDRIQVWEINTNPTIGPMPKTRPRTSEELAINPVEEPGRLHFHAGFRDALRAIDLPEGPPIRLRLPACLCARLRAERGVQALRRMKSRLVRRLGR